mmetsp:Transcript_22052/g.36433  ORF Transcript_22052/g.36433 Transcript_22052/m.36433 type:complete len:221 (+) Transcript_22052:745-1407(+)
MSPRVLGSTMPTAVVALLPCCRHSRQSVRTTASTSLQLCGSMMPIVVLAQPLCCKGRRVNAKTTASMSPKLLGNMTPTVVAVLQLWQRLRPARSPRSLVPKKGQSFGSMIPIARAVMPVRCRSQPNARNIASTSRAPCGVTMPIVRAARLPWLKQRSIVRTTANSWGPCCGTRHRAAVLARAQCSRAGRSSRPANARSTANTLALTCGSMTPTAMAAVVH